MSWAWPQGTEGRFSVYVTDQAAAPDSMIMSDVCSCLNLVTGVYFGASVHLADFRSDVSLLHALLMGLSPSCNSWNLCCDSLGNESNNNWFHHQAISGFTLVCVWCGERVKPGRLCGRPATAPGCGASSTHNLFLESCHGIVNGGVISTPPWEHMARHLTTAANDLFYLSSICLRWTQCGYWHWSYRY